jgi:uncharacterized Zn finger protein
MMARRKNNVNIKDFEKRMDAKIVSRGREYHKSGYVTTLEYDEDDGEWTAEVTGSEYYTVTVRLAESGDIAAAYCDCPYD